TRVLAMLGADAAKVDFLETSRFGQAFLLEAIAGSDPYAGTTLGPYRIEEQLGEGGMGFVYLAERTDAFRKKVAIKIIKKGMDSRALLDRFRLERQTLANLEHPHIARLLDGGSTEEGLPYLVLEYVDGQIITEYCDQQRLSLRERLQLFGKVCQAVSYAHRNLVVHRDIKPSNILVNHEGEPRLLDFGIARILDSETGESTATTRANERMLTPEYASPEQIRGEKVSTASDIYALGILLYRLLSGHRPYHFPNRSAAGIEAVISGHQPEPPSHLFEVRKARAGKPDEESPADPMEISAARRTTPDKLRRLLSGDLDNIILKALRKEPERRYGTVDQFAEDIERYLAGLPVNARKDSRSYLAAKFIRRHRLALAAITAVFLALITAVGGISWQASKANLEAAKTRQTLEFVKRMLAAADPQESGKELTVEQLLDAASDRIDKEFGDQPAIEWEIRSLLGEAYQHLSRYDKAEAHFSANLPLVREQRGENSPEMANAYREMAVLYDYSGDYTTADSFYRLSADRFRSVNATNTPEYGLTLNDHASMLLQLERPDSAEAMLRESLNILNNTRGPMGFDTGIAVENLGTAVGDQRRYDEVAPLYQRALNIFNHNYPDGHPETANVYNNWSFYVLENGDTARSIELQRKARDMWASQFDADHVNVALATHNMAALLFYTGKYDEALQEVEKSTRTFEDAYDGDHPNIASAYFMRGRIFWKLGRFREAERDLRAALSLREKQPEPSHSQIASVYYTLGDLCRDAHRPPEAIRHYEAALGHYRLAGESEAHILPVVAGKLAELYRA
nr:serine/threonine-protein kinase [Calditrichia bacterium]